MIFLYSGFMSNVVFYCSLTVYSGHVKYKVFLSAIEYLPFSPGDDSKGSFEEIIERFFLSLLPFMFQNWIYLTVLL